MGCEKVRLLGRDCWGAAAAPGVRLPCAPLAPQLCAAPHTHRPWLLRPQVKKVLTTNSEAPINVECLMNDVDASGMITHDVFEQKAAPVFARLVAPVQKVGPRVWRVAGD